MVSLKRYSCLISVICFIASLLLVILPEYSVHITIWTLLASIVLIIGIVFVLMFYFVKGLSVFGRACVMISPIVFIAGLFYSIYPKSFFEGSPHPIIFWLFTSLSIILLMAGLVLSYLGDSKKKRNQ